MNGLDNPLEKGNARYARKDFHFGEEPKGFVHARMEPETSGSLKLAPGRVSVTRNSDSVSRISLG